MQFYSFVKKSATEKALQVVQRIFAYSNTNRISVDKKTSRRLPRGLNIKGEA